MKTSHYSKVFRTFGTLLAALSIQTYSHANVVGVLDPLFVTGPAGLASGGLAGNWFKVDNNAQFSNALWNDETGTKTIKSYGWGTGIWSVADVAGIAANPAPAYITGTTTSVGAVSFANNIYNNTFISGAYGVWGTDYVRPLAPTVGAANSCNTTTQDSLACVNEQNYAAIFTGYVYVATTSFYDFGVFADDVFRFSLVGVNGMYGMSHDNVAGSSGRVQESLLTENGLSSLQLSQGFYAIELSYANRLESGVLDLGWKGPGDTGWRTIDGGDLYHVVPEPTTLALVALAMLGLWNTRRRRFPCVASVAA
jgi:hypothetical protein